MTTAEPRSRKGAETRARLLDAAKQVFADDGFLNARVTDISDRAGLSHGSFYHYFDSKEQVFREVAEDLDRQLSEPLHAVILAPLSGLAPAERLREALRRHLESYRAEARLMGVVEQVTRYDDEVHQARAARHRRYTAEMAESIRELQRQGMADASLDPNFAAMALGAMVRRFAEMWLVHDFFECSVNVAVEQLTAVYVNGLKLRSHRKKRNG